MTIQIIYIAAVVVVLFGATIFAHELGHFFAARLLGMVVDVFSLGFGPAIWKRKINGVVYQVASIPVGGYVALPQMDPELGMPRDDEKTDDTAEKEEPPEPPRDLPHLAPWKKIIVAVAGAAGNIILAILLSWAVYWLGKPSTPGERCAVIGFVEPDSPAYRAGVLTGDEIVEVNGRSVENWNDVLQENARVEIVTLSLKRGREIVKVAIPTEKNLIGLRVVEGLRESSICKVKSVDPDSSAARAGMLSGDIVKLFNDEEVLSVDHLVALVSLRPDQETPIVVERDGALVLLRVTPRMHPELERAVIGIRFDPMAFDYDRKVHIRPSVQLKRHATMILRVVRSLLTPKEAKATSEGLCGPFIIIFMFVEMVKRSLVTALWFTCFLNVNLAILNMLPIPILDGGHVVFALWELVVRKPAHPRVVIWLSNFFAGLLILAIVLLSGRDLQRILQIHRILKPPADQHEICTNAAPDTSAPDTSVPDTSVPDDDELEAATPDTDVQLDDIPDDEAQRVE